MLTSASAKVRLPQILGNDMMLQQNANANIWGWAEKGAKVTITTSWDKKQKVVVTADSKSGRWKAQIATPQGSYVPQQITISDGQPITLGNVLIGEVWFGSGQSNMEMPLNGFWNCPVENGNAEILGSAKYKGKLRMATIPKVEAYEPQDTVAGEWKECDPFNAPWFSATGYFFIRNLQEVLNVPVGLINCSWGGSKVEGWTPKHILEQYPDVATTEEEIKKESQQYLRPMIMYNGMLHPLLGYTVRGFIWYQGCSNVGKHDTYTDRFATMITNFRKEFGQGDLPFYYVEVAPYNYGGKDEGALIREAQYFTQKKVPNCGMISTNDLAYEYELNQIHPCQKQKVGQRLAFMALNKTYGYTTIECYGPEYKSMEKKDDKIILSFDYAHDGFNRLTDIKGFEISENGKDFVKADVEVEQNKRQLIVSANGIKNPTAVRYCFHDFCVGNMANTRGLPMVPFRTDRK